MKRIIYCLGNPLIQKDSLPLKLMPHLKAILPSYNFEVFDPTEVSDISDNSIFLDTVTGINKVKIFTGLKYFLLSPRNSVHDYDIPLLLGLMLKLGKIKKFKIIGVPANYSFEEAYESVKGCLKDNGI